MESSFKDRRLKALLGILIILLGANWVSCTKEPLQLAAKKSQTCKPYWFTSPEEDPRCYELQERLSKAAVAGDISRIKEAIKDGANVNGGYYQSLPYWSKPQAKVEARPLAIL